MGGNAFPDLHVPRIPNSVHSALTTRFASILQELFAKVQSPPECPEKSDHGDIDILVGEPLPNINITTPVKLTADTIVEAVGAAKWLGNCIEGSTLNLAVPDGTAEAGVEIYRQLDVHVCRPGGFEWEVFKRSYGDMWNIIGSNIRSFGFTATDAGFYVRIAEIERLDGTRAKIFLTKSPAETLRFLGLDEQQFRTGWKTLDDMFQWIIAGKYFDREVFREKGDYLRTNDLKRMKLRPIYRRFVLEFVSSLPPDIGGRVLLTRDEALKIALDHFNAESAYDKTLSSWRAEMKSKAAWEKVANAIPSDSFSEKTRIIKALKKRISLIPGIKCTVTEDTNLVFPVFLRPDDTIDEDGLVVWVASNWETFLSKWPRGEKTT